MKAEQIAADQMMHRVAWLDRHTRESGAGGWTAYRGAAECYVVEQNKRGRDRVVHWVESMPISQIIER